MSQEISREALLIYLNNVRILETLIPEDQKKISELEKTRNFLGAEEYRRLTKPDNPPRPPIEPVKPEFNITFCVIFAVIAFVSFYIAVHLNTTGKGFFAPVFYSSGLLFSVLLINNIVLDYLKERKEYLHRRVVYPREYERYNEAKQQYDLELQAYQHAEFEIRQRTDRSKNEITALQNTIKENINHAQQDLREAYDANIIPLPFRDIHGVYYLYDYLSTSNESLTSALMQANLEAIKQKLDNMIALQGAMMIQQAQANQILFAQNQQILETAQGIENNTFVAAQYAKISAVNSTVSLRLQEEQLAYQKADYWLHIND